MPAGRCVPDIVQNYPLISGLFNDRPVRKRCRGLGDQAHKNETVTLGHEHGPQLQITRRPCCSAMRGYADTLAGAVEFEPVIRADQLAVTDGPETKPSSAMRTAV